MNRSLYNQGLRVGADVPAPFNKLAVFKPATPANDWTVLSNLRNFAIRNFTPDAPNAKHFVVAVDRKLNSGGFPLLSIFNFDDAKSAADKYGELGDRPGSFQFIALVDRTQADLADNDFIKDEAFFVATQVAHTHTATKVINRKTTQSSFGWVVAGIAGLIGVVALGGKK